MQRDRPIPEATVIPVLTHPDGREALRDVAPAEWGGGLVGGE